MGNGEEKFHIATVILSSQLSLKDHLAKITCFVIRHLYPE
jgi:hypothetical protein